MRAVWPLFALLLALPTGVVPARAGESAGGDVRLEATAGLDGNVGTSRPYPVIVDVSSPRLLAGTLVLVNDSDTGRRVVQRPIEVAGGTTKRYALTVATPNAFGGEQLLVTVVEDGNTVATASPKLVSEEAGELVGVLPGLAAGLDRTSTPVAVGTSEARLGPIPPEVLAEGPVALEVYDQIAAGPGDLDDLSDRDLSSVTRWVGQGGYLLVDGGDPAATLPEGLDPSPGTAKVVGLGRVVLTDGVLTAGRWEDVLVLTPVRSQAAEEILSSGLSVTGDVTGALAADAGFDLPSIRTILLVLAGYTLTVGPLAWFAVRRRRTTLLWAIIPAVALLTTGLVQVAGSEFRSSSDSAHITMIETGPGGAMGTTSVFVAGQGGGTTTLDLPDGWLTAPNQFFDNFGFGGEQDRPLVRLGDRSQVAVDAGVGGAAVLRARGPLELDGALVVSASSDVDGAMRGTVENTLDVDLEDVAVMVSRSTAVAVGDLPAGATAEWETDQATRFEFGAQAEATVWPLDVDPSLFGFGPGEVAFDPNTGEPIAGARTDDPGSLTSSLSGYGDLLAARGSNFKPPGQAVAVGWTRALDAPVRVGGRPVSGGRTGIVGRGEVVSSGGRLVDTGSVRFLVRGPNEAGAMAAPAGGAAPPNDGSTALALFAFAVPSVVGDRPVDPARLTLHTTALFTRVQVWAAGRWQDLPSGDGEIPLPGGSLVGQTVFARVQVGVDQVPAPGREFVLYEAES